MIRLGVNIDHVATVRQARGEAYPDPVQAALMAELGGADNITCHLREDRRHVQDRDVFLLKDTIKIPLNFEMAATPEMVKIALNLKPHAVTLVPEKRAERTTEGGLDLKANAKNLAKCVGQLSDAGIVVSLFVEPTEMAALQSIKLGAQAVEFHTGKICHELDAAALTKDKYFVASRLASAGVTAAATGLQVHLGHGINYANATWFQFVSTAEEANVGHAIIGRALFVGLQDAVAEMKRLLNDPTLKPFVPLAKAK